MQIVIEIPEEDYIRLRDEGMFGNVTTFKRAVREGIPLPKGHGDLIDKNEIIKRYEKDCGRRIYVDNFIHDIELNMQTIIEADKGRK